jgi:phosphoserine phosphatase RsbU/P
MAQPQEDTQVLMVDDSAVYRKLVADTLFYQPYSVEFAETGREALEFLAKQSPSIVIVDWMLPDLSGLELCQQIRASAGRDYTYVILLTSMAEKENVVKGLDAGADDYLTKPFDPDELKARLGVGRRITALCREIKGEARQVQPTERPEGKQPKA